MNLKAKIVAWSLIAVTLAAGIWLVWSSFSDSATQIELLRQQNEQQAEHRCRNELSHTYIEELEQEQIKLLVQQFHIPMPQLPKAPGVASSSVLAECAGVPTLPPLNSAAKGISAPKPTPTKTVVKVIPGPTKTVVVTKTKTVLKPQPTKTVVSCELPGGTPCPKAQAQAAVGIQASALEVSAQADVQGCGLACGLLAKLPMLLPLGFFSMFGKFNGRAH